MYSVVISSYQTTKQAKIYKIKILKSLLSFPYFLPDGGHRQLIREVSRFRLVGPFAPCVKSEKNAVPSGQKRQIFDPHF